MRHLVSIIIIGVVALAGLSPVRAQDLSGDRTTLFTFDVASIKRNVRGNSLTPPPHNTMLAENFTVRMLIRNAYGVTAAEMAGGPSWIDSERYDVRAKYTEGTTRDQQSHMLASLLVDRFHLETHAEMRRLHVYELVLARADGRLGPQLTPTNRDCATEPPLTKDALIEAHDTLTPPCGFGQTVDQGDVASAQEMWQLVTFLSRAADIARPVVDNTGLNGKFDYSLSWTSLAPRDATQAGPSIFVALEEQLGLRLKAVDDVRPVLVIDHVERPTED